MQSLCRPSKFPKKCSCGMAWPRGCWVPAVPQDPAWGSSLPPDPPQGPSRCPFSRAQIDFYPAISKIAYPKFGWMPADEEASKAAAEEVVTHMQFIAKHLVADKPFIAGDRPSIADYSIVVSACLLRVTPSLPIPAEFQAYADRFAAASANYAACLAAVDAFIASKVAGE